MSLDLPSKENTISIVHNNSIMLSLGGVDKQTNNNFIGGHEFQKNAKPDSRCRISMMNTYHTERHTNRTIPDL